MSELEFIKGIGKATIDKLNKLEIYSVDDLITYYPFRYEVLKKTSLNDEHSVITGTIETIPTLNYFRRINKLSFKLETDNKLINVVIFNRGFLKEHLIVGKIITLIGKYEQEKNMFTASDIKLIDIGDSTHIMPIYHKVKGLTDKNINKYINLALEREYVIDYIPDKIIDKYKFLPKKESLNLIHNPSNNVKLKEALIRSKYEELFLFMLKINELKNKNSINNIGYSKEIDLEKINKFIDTLPFTLTEDQFKTLDEIFDDLKSSERMNRLVQGDVGSGKTIVAIISMYAMHLNNYQSALMAPTEILAHQHYENMINLFKDYDINIKEILGSTPKKDKEIIKEELKQGKIDMIIGTHALLEETIEFNNLGLIITDEQHRFGVNQRSSLRNKGNMPDVLYLSATPIPRTYALTIYGDMDVSSIKTMPGGRLDVITSIKKTKEIKDVLDMMSKELSCNHQVYVIAPLIEESDKSDLDSVYEIEANMKKAFKDKYNIGILHGKLTNEEKDIVMDKFKNNDIQILISTTVVEVGVDVANATLMVIYDAYRFGLSALHQLRGRVGRNNIQSYCVLISDRETERLNVLVNTNDGFKVSEEDFKMRGSGDLFGYRQSGDMVFNIADLKKDFDILLKARDDSMEFLKLDDTKYDYIKGLIYKAGNLD